MLSLSRSTGEKVIITVPPSDTPTTIEHVTGEIRYGSRRVKQEYTAPPEVKIHRLEVQQRLDAEIDRLPTLVPRYEPASRRRGQRR